MKQILALLLALLPVAAAFMGPLPRATKSTSTQLYENFGLGLGEDSYANTVDPLLGEVNYKQFVNRLADNAFVNRQYNVVRRVRELNLLKATANAGVLSSLEQQGLDLATIEKLLPLLEDLNVLGVVANNQQLLVNGVAPVLVEGAPLLLPVVAGALRAGPSAFYAAAAACGGLEVYMVATNAEVPLVGLPAGAVLGLLLVPLTIVFAGVGTALASIKK